MNKLRKLYYKTLNPGFSSMRVPELKTKQKIKIKKNKTKKNQNLTFHFVSHFTGLYCKEKKNIQQLLLWTFHIPTYKWITNTIQGSTLLLF